MRPFLELVELPRVHNAEVALPALITGIISFITLIFAMVMVVLSNVSTTFSPKLLLGLSLILGVRRRPRPERACDEAGWTRRGFSLDRAALRTITHSISQNSGMEVDMYKHILLPTDGSPFSEEEKNCDLIIMASHGRSGVKTLLIGSETQKGPIRRFRCWFTVEHGPTRPPWASASGSLILDIAGRETHIGEKDDGNTRFPGSALNAVQNTGCTLLGTR